MLSAGLEEGDIKTTACNENPHHGNANQSEFPCRHGESDLGTSTNLQSEENTVNLQELKLRTRTEDPVLTATKLSLTVYYNCTI